MPRIAEIRQIDGECWVRIEVMGDEGSAAVWTGEEVRAHDKDIRAGERLRCILALEALKDA